MTHECLQNSRPHGAEYRVAQTPAENSLLEAGEEARGRIRGEDKMQPTISLGLASAFPHQLKRFMRHASGELIRAAGGN